MIRLRTLDGTARLVHIIRYLVPALLLLIVSSGFKPERVRDHYAEVLRGFKDEKKLFVSDFFASEVDGSFDGTELACLCGSKAWHQEDKALILTCSPIPGGVGEVKNGLLRCIRFAIEIGDLSRLHGHHAKGQPVEYMFSSEHLTASLEAHCPQMRVYQSLDDLYDQPSLFKPLPVGFEMLTGETAMLNDTSTSVLKCPEKLTDLFAHFLDREPPRERRRYPVRIELSDTIFQWPAHHDVEAFRHDFGRLLRVRDDMRLLAASAVWNLARRFNLPLDPRRGIHHNPAQGGHARLVGLHLRTEEDITTLSLQVGTPLFPGYEEQAGYLLNYLRQAGVPGRVVYVATGPKAADEDVKRLSAQAAELGATVVTKWNLLDAEEVSLLKRLTWDQRALVDYEVLLRAGFVLGLVQSSFAWNVAMRRGNAYGGGAHGVGAEYGGFLAVPGEDPGKMMLWQDRYSKLLGSSAAAVSMYYGMWP